jgi:hypothetical protein
MPTTVQRDEDDDVAVVGSASARQGPSGQRAASWLRWLAEVASGGLILTVFAVGVVWGSRVVDAVLTAPRFGGSAAAAALSLLMLAVGLFSAFVAGKPIASPGTGSVGHTRHHRGPEPRRRGGGGGGPPPWLRWLPLALALALALATGWNVARRLDVFEVLMRHSFLACMLVSVAILQLTLRRPVLRLQTWKKLSDVWLKLGGATGLSLGAIGVLVSTDVLKKVTEASVRSPYVDQPFLIAAYFVVLALFGFAWILTVTGRASAASDESGLPRSLFVPAFAVTWLACAGVFALFFDALLLGMHAATRIPA